MRPLILVNSRKDSLVWRGLAIGIPIWLVGQFCIGIIAASYFSNLEEKKLAEQRVEVSRTLSELFSELSIYGDQIYAKGVVQIVGKPQGLSKVSLCRGKVDLFQELGSSSCEVKNEFRLASKSNGIDLVFEWQTMAYTAESFWIPLAASLLIGSALILFAMQSISRGISGQVQSLADEISKLIDIRRDGVLVPQFKEFVPITRAIQFLRCSWQDEIKKNVRLQVENRLGDEMRRVARQVAHDLSSPLGAIRLVASQEGGLGGEEIKLLIASADRIEKISEDLKTRGPDARVQSVKLNQLIFDLINELRRTMGDVLLVFHSELEDHEQVFVNPEELRRVVSNLCLNAVEAGANHVDVTLTKNSNGRARLSIQDDGKGISQDHLDRIWDEGFTLGKVGGSGLGLFYVRSCVQKWKAEISVSTQLNEGTVFTILW